MGDNGYYPSGFSCGQGLGLKLCCKSGIVFKFNPAGDLLEY